jgi:hypothetical protein
MQTSAHAPSMRMRAWMSTFRRGSRDFIPDPALTTSDLEQVPEGAPFRRSR